MKGATAVAGIGTTDLLRHGESERTSLQLTVEAVSRACEDAGLTGRDIDGFVSYGHDPSEGLAVGAAVGAAEVRFSSMVWGGGGGGLAAAINSAAMAITAGQASRVVVYRGIAEKDVGRGSYSAGHMQPGYTRNGIFAPAQICALRTMRMLEVEGVPRQTLAELSLTCYAHAQANPAAVAHGKPLDSETYWSSRVIAEPLRLFDCSRENDGAGALLLVSAEEAVDLPHPPAYVLGGVQGAGPGWSESVENETAYTGSGFHPTMVERLWEHSGVGRDDVDVVQVYENFTGPAVSSLIDLGFAPRSPEAGAVLTRERMTVGGDGVPVNTAGGNLAEGFVHGIHLALEAVRQVRGASCNQVRGRGTAGPADVSLLLGGPMAPLVSASVFGSAAAAGR